MPLQCGCACDFSLTRRPDSQAVWMTAESLLSGKCASLICVFLSSDNLILCRCKTQCLHVAHTMNAVDATRGCNLRHLSSCA